MAVHLADETSTSFLVLAPTLGLYTWQNKRGLFFTAAMLYQPLSMNEAITYVRHVFSSMLRIQASSSQPSIGGTAHRGIPVGISGFPAALHWLRWLWQPGSRVAARYLCTA